MSQWAHLHSSPSAEGTIASSHHDAGYTALHTAVLLCDLPTISSLIHPLLSDNADHAKVVSAATMIDSRTFLGRTPLLLACMGPDIGVMVRALVAAGADIHALAADGSTPLRFLVANGAATTANAIGLKLGPHRCASWRVSQSD
eukprot:TRINITY_DN4882_c0_g1_i2.p2 TRINITY_DN4882_c0_g1~~TRINITY_DN4882_c0_g1_i2.p2  ORF type:complete len:144 (-),score=6.97 TRINITY_DN4882_c0_g1_i2:59-490(-)